MPLDAAQDPTLRSWVASANGSVYTYGDAPNDGSEAGQHLNGSIIAATGW